MSTHSTMNNVLFICTVSTCPMLKSILAIAVWAMILLKYSLGLFQDFFCTVKWTMAESCPTVKECRALDV